MIFRDFHWFSLHSLVSLYSLENNENTKENQGNHDKMSLKTLFWSLPSIKIQQTLYFITRKVLRGRTRVFQLGGADHGVPLDMTCRPDHLRRPRTMDWYNYG